MISLEYEDDWSELRLMLLRRKLQEVVKDNKRIVKQFQYFITCK